MKGYFKTFLMAKKTNYRNNKILLLFILPFWAILKIGEAFRSFVNLVFGFLFFVVIYPIRITRQRLVFKTPKKEKRREKKQKSGFKLSPFKIGLTVVLISVFVLGYFFFLIIATQDLPSPQRLSEGVSPVATEFYDRNGKLLYRLYEGKDRTPVNLDELPPYVIEATLAIEDKNFYAHSGIDLFGMLRAIKAYVKDGQVQGGSTLTQQLIKNTLLTPDRTLTRKTKEILLSFWAERIFSKKEILQMYFNEVPYGGPAWGIQAGAQTYFNKNAHDLNLAEASFLAGLPASPSTYSPYGANPESGKMRQKEVLRRMVEEGFITREEADQAAASELEIKPPLQTIKAPHFVMYVRELLAKRYGERVVSQGGLHITTTLDLNTQEMAEGVVFEEVSKLSYLNVSNGAAMIVDGRTGQILAMVGSKDYWDPKIGNFNVTTALRQPGSSIKPITYATGFKIGYSPGTILLDAPVSFKNAWETYSPVNYDGSYHGPVTIRQALGSSYNIPAVKMLAMVGIPEMISTAKDMGITTFNDPSEYGLSLTLGGGEVRLIDMMSVYDTLSQNGIRREVQPILKITDYKGNVLQDNQNPESKQVIAPAIAYLITDVLADNKARTPAFGPNSQLFIPGRSVAVKTGTTDSKRDNWTFGYTPDLVVGAWVGNNNNSPMDPALTSGVTGAAPIWNKLMTNLLEGRENLTFTKPEDVAEALVDGRRDLVISGQVQKSVVGFGKRKIKDAGGVEKDVISFTDPFSTFIPDSNTATKVNP